MLIAMLFFDDPQNRQLPSWMTAYVHVSAHIVRPCSIGPISSKHGRCLRRPSFRQGAGGNVHADVQNVLGRRNPGFQTDLASLAGSKNKPRPHSQPSATASGAAAAAAAGEDDTVDMTSEFATAGEGGYAPHAGNEAMPVHSGRSQQPMPALHDRRGGMREPPRQLGPEGRSVCDAQARGNLARGASPSPCTRSCCCRATSSPTTSRCSLRAAWRNEHILRLKDFGRCAVWCEVHLLGLKDSKFCAAWCDGRLLRLKDFTACVAWCNDHIMLLISPGMLETSLVLSRRATAPRLQACGAQPGTMTVFCPTDSKKISAFFGRAEVCGKWTIMLSPKMSLSHPRGRSLGVSLRARHGQSMLMWAWIPNRRASCGRTAY